MSATLSGAPADERRIKTGVYRLGVAVGNSWRLKIERSDYVEMHDATKVVSWSVWLKCPHCGQRGGATLSESGADPWFRVETIAPEFKVLDRPGRAPDIRCVECNASSLCG